MKTMKRTCPVLLCLLAIIMFLPVHSQAAGAIDVEHASTLTISYTDNGTPLVGAEFALHQVASVDPYGSFTLTDTFAGYPISLEGLDEAGWRELTTTLEGYILRDDIAPLDSGKTNEQGLLVFPNEQDTLYPGLYLVRGQRHTQDGYVYTSLPFMIMLPGLDSEANEWDYDVTASPKFTSKPDEPEETTVTRKVLKVWKDEGHEHERPKEITVQLLRDGEVYETVTLSEENNWRYSWEDLDDDYAWTVVENDPEDYTVKITKEGITFVVTNTYDKETPETPPPTEPDVPGTPPTGQLLWPGPMLVVAGISLVLIGLIRRRGVEDEK